MKNIFRITLLVLLSGMIKAQDCNCLTEFDFVKTYFEKNSPAYNSKTSQQLKDYKKRAAVIRDKILKKKPDVECIFYLQQYVRLMKDNHSNIEQAKFNLKDIDENDSVAVAEILNSELYKRQKTVPLSNETIEKLKHSDDPVEGIYHDFKNDFKIAVIRNENSQKDYKGIVLETTSKLWKYGFVKMEISKVMNDLYNITLYTKSFQRVCGSSIVRNGNIYNFGWMKVDVSSDNNQQSPLEFHPINDSVNYMRLSSFDGKLFSALDSFYLTTKKDVTSKKFLIIDLRNNGGGNDKNYTRLLPYIYSKPMAQPSVEIFATQENKKRYYDRVIEMKYDTIKFSDEEINSTNYVLQRMMTSGKDGFISYISAEQQPYVISDPPKFPERVVVLQNSLTASAAEGFIIQCMQSKKVITIGENTGGYVGYGNVFESKTATGCFKIYNTTLRYKDFFKYELKGVPPKKYLSSGTDWIAAALDAMKN